MPPVLVILSSSLAISLVATPAVRRLAISYGVLDHALSSRKVHGRPVPRMGGLAIVAGIYGSLGIAFLIAPVREALLADGWRTIGLALAGIAVAALGLFDDLRGADARKKLAVQLTAALFLYTAGFRVTLVENPLGGADLALGALSLPVTLLWIAGVSNAVNLIDGLDGLAGGVALAAAVALFAIGASIMDLPAMLVAAALAGALLGFLVYNVNPASIFMGDTGSLFLGTVLAALALRPHPYSHHVPLVAVALALAIPVADTLIAIVRRAARGAPLFHADRGHVHHRLLGLGLSHRQAVLVLWSGSAILAAAGVQLADRRCHRAFLLVAVLVVSGAALRRLGMLRLPDAEMLERRGRNRDRLRTVQTTGKRLRQAAAVGEVQDELVAAAPLLDARAVWLRRVAAGADTAPPRPGAGARDVAGQPSRFYLDASRPELGLLEVAWRERGPRPDPDLELAFEILSRHVASTIQRIESGAQPAAWLDPVRGLLGERERPVA